MTRMRGYVDVTGRAYEPEPWDDDRYDALAEAESEAQKYRKLYEDAREANIALMARIRRLEAEAV